MRCRVAEPRQEPPRAISLKPRATVMSMRREASVAVAIVALGLVLAFAAPGFFARDNLGDLFLANLPVLIVALGMTLIILTGEIDISVGSVFAICGCGRRAPGQGGAADAARRRVGLSRRRRPRRPQRRARRLRADSVDRRLARDDGGLARRPALGDRRRLDSGFASGLPVAGPDPGRLSVRRVGHGRRAHARRSPGVSATSRPAARSTRPARTAKPRAWPGCTRHSSPLRYSCWPAA